MACQALYRVGHGHGHGSRSRGIYLDSSKESWDLMDCVLDNVSAFACVSCLEWRLGSGAMGHGHGHGHGVFILATHPEGK